MSFRDTVESPHLLGNIYFYTSYVSNWYDINPPQQLFPLFSTLPSPFLLGKAYLFYRSQLWVSLFFPQCSTSITFYTLLYYAIIALFSCYIFACVSSSLDLLIPWVSGLLLNLISQVPKQSQTDIIDIQYVCWIIDLYMFKAIFKMILKATGFFCKFEILFR